MDKKNIVTCSFTMDRDTYYNYKSVVTKNGENVKDNLVSYMTHVIEHATPNAETIAALEEVKRLKTDPNKKTYESFAEIMKDIGDE